MKHLNGIRKNPVFFTRNTRIDAGPAKAVKNENGKIVAVNKGTATFTVTLTGSKYESGTVQDIRTAIVHITVR